MKLYCYAGALDVAATTLADLILLVPAYLDQSQADNLEVIARVTAKIRALTHADTGEPLELYFYDDAGVTPSSWVASASTTLACGLGDPDPSTAYTYASTSSFTISGGARHATLSLNTTALRDALFRQIAARRGGLGVFTLHLRKTTAGVTTTVLRLPVRVDPGVLALTTAETGGFTWSDVPASPTATGTAGASAYDESYLYLCIATDTWARIPLSDWTGSTAGGSGSGEWSDVPATSTSSGTAGDKAYDESYIYVCIATNTWARAPINDWT